MNLRTLNTADPTLNRIQDNVAEALRPIPDQLKGWRLTEGAWPSPSSPAVLQIQHFESGQWVTRAAWSAIGALAVPSGVGPALLASGAASSGSWTGLPYGASWLDWTDANYYFGAYRKNALGKTELRGLVQCANAANTCIGTVPAGYRSAKGLIFEVSTSSGRAPILVGANGSITFNGTPPTAAWISLSGVSWDAEQ